MNNRNLKRWIIPNLPYILFVYLFDKAAQAVRLAPGADLSGKLLGIGNGFTSAFASPLPSFSSVDMLIGIAGKVCAGGKPYRLCCFVKKIHKEDIR